MGCCKADIIAVMCLAVCSVLKLSMELFHISASYLILLLYHQLYKVGRTQSTGKLTHVTAIFAFVIMTALRYKLISKSDSLFAEISTTLMED